MQKVNFPGAGKSETIKKATLLLDFKNKYPHLNAYDLLTIQTQTKRKIEDIVFIHTMTGDVKKTIQILST